MKKERVFWGVLFIIGAIALVVSKLGYFADINVISIVFTIILAGIIIKSIVRLNFGGILFPLAFIGIIYDDQLGITAITPWTVLFAALLGTIGLSMIFHKHCFHHHGEHFGKYEGKLIESEDEGHIKVDNSFTESIKYVKSQEFEQADLDCSFGSIKVYFDNAALKDGKGLVRIDASFAGVELYVPKEWTVVVRTENSFGGVSEKNNSLKLPDNELTIVGEISFAGLTIIYV